jgi:hypothetical protein
VQVRSLPRVAGSDSLPSQALFSPVHTKTVCGQNLALAAWQYHMRRIGDAPVAAHITE